MTTQPIVSEPMVRKIFADLEHGNGDGFFAHVADNVDWTVMGTHPLAGRYHSKAAFRAGTFEKLGKVLPHGTQLRVTNVVVAGDVAVVELVSDATAQNGMRFDNHYCWLVRFAPISTRQKLPNYSARTHSSRAVLATSTKRVGQRALLLPECWSSSF